MSIPLEDLLSSRYSPPAWAFLREVPNGTGYAKDRTADAIAMSLWPSRGLDLHGFEIKKSRNDWLRELKKPQKAEAFVGYCDYWWIVAEKDVVKLDEVPPTWGLLVRAGKTLRVKKEAPKLDPDPPDRPFLASLFRQTSTIREQYVKRSEIQEELDKKWREGIERGEEIADHKKDRDAREHEHLKRTVKEFEEASGVKIPEYGGGKRLGEAVKLVLGGDVDRHAHHLERVAKQLSDISERVLESVAEWKESTGPDELTLVKAAFLRLSDCIEMMGVLDENRFEFGIRAKAWRMLTANSVDDSFSNFHEAREFLRTWEDKDPSEDDR